MNDIGGYCWYLWKWWGCRILNKGHLATPVFKDHRTLVCEMI
jgi:hypothetical protein